MLGYVEVWFGQRWAGMVRELDSSLLLTQGGFEPLPCLGNYMTPHYTTFEWPFLKPSSNVVYKKRLDIIKKISSEYSKKIVTFVHSNSKLVDSMPIITQPCMDVRINARTNRCHCFQSKQVFCFKTIILLIIPR